jgi:exopolysaccharide biosynthesis protein
MKQKRHLPGIFYGLLLAAFTLYILLDTFTISRVMVQVPTRTPTVPSIPPEQIEITETSYRDGNISITITEYREHDTTIYVADVQLSSPEYLRTALAKNAYGRNIKEKTSEMAKNNGALLAINGDYYGSREKGYVLRNGVLYRDKGSSDREDLVVWGDGSFQVISEKNTSAASLLEQGAMHVLSFGPALVKDGQVSVTKNQEVGQATYSNPRTAIAIVDELHYLLVVSDGRTDRSEGLSLYQLAQFLQSKGAKTAYNLDGGGSSTMVFNGELINHPTTSGNSVKERSVSDIVYIGS